jgi:hypothetical protein
MGHKFKAQITSVVILEKMDDNFQVPAAPFQGSRKQYKAHYEDHPEAPWILTPEAVEEHYTVIGEVEEQQAGIQESPDAIPPMADVPSTGGVPPAGSVEEPPVPPEDAPPQDSPAPPEPEKMTPDNW